MQVDDGVDAVLGTQVDDAVEVLEARFLEFARVHVVLEVAVVYLVLLGSSAVIRVCRRIRTGRRRQFRPSDEKNFASASVKKYSRNWGWVSSFTAGRLSLACGTVLVY
jgi:hypothetical protein